MTQDPTVQTTVPLLTDERIAELVKAEWMRTPADLLERLKSHGMEMYQLNAVNQIGWDMDGFTATFTWEIGLVPELAVRMEVQHRSEHMKHHVHMTGTSAQAEGLVHAAINLARQYLGTALEPGTVINGYTTLGHRVIAQWREHHFPQKEEKLPVVNMQFDGRAVEPTYKEGDLEDVTLRVPASLVKCVQDEAQRLGVSADWVFSNILANTTLAQITSIAQSLKASAKG